MTVLEFKPSEFEPKWRSKWEEEGVYVADLEAKNKYYNLWMFPYPSAEGVHVGTIFSSTGSDVFGRFMRMRGKEVFQPMGYDSFGIHSENYALKIGEAPPVFANRAIHNYERQFKEIGHGYDWTRTVTTSNPDYYKWTQWLFVQMFKAGLAYKQKSAVNWCPSCKTVLADEQVTTPAQAGKWPKKYATLEEVPDGVRVCERCGNEPERKELEQWFFKITQYADRLLEGLERIDWSERVVIAQREWIGRKMGININYPVEGTQKQVTCFTTRPDTNFGATFIVVAPEYARDNLLDVLTPEKCQEVEGYIAQALNKSEQQRKEEGREKTGVFTGLYVINQLNGTKLPVWVSDFVLMGFGTGAVVGVPGHDKRDFEFAQAMKLPIVRVVVGSDGDTSEITELKQVQEEAGKMINSEFLNGVEINEAIEKMMDHLEAKKWGKRVTTYHLRDWLVSRQRYWGPPIPMIWCEKCGWQSVPEDQLPVKLPEITDYQPEGNGKGPLANHPEFYRTNCPKCGGEATRETDVSDTFVDSAWYFLRYPSTRLESADRSAWDTEVTRKWLPVDLYFGGAEHSVLHLMYARFVTKALYDLKLIDFDEPFPKFFAHGLMIKDGAKMSKSKGNVVNPDEYIKKYGADALRLYLMFMGPMDGYPDFRDSGMEGMVRWLKRVWKVLLAPPVEKNELDGKLNQTVAKVTEFLAAYKNNTAIAELMKFMNLAEVSGMTLNQIDIFVRLLAPFAPHACEEIWAKLGKPFSIHRQAWPVAKEQEVNEPVTVVVQVAGKVRGKVLVEFKSAANQQIVEKIAKENDNVKRFLKGGERVVFVPNRLINFI